MPTPPAAFSPFTTTKSGWCCFRRAGSSEPSVRRPTPPTTSPTKISFTARDSVTHLLSRNFRLGRVRTTPTNVSRMEQQAAARPGPPVRPAADAPVLEADGLVKRFGEREALRGVSLAAGRGELVAVIGPNGAGKTTLLSILAGIQRADSGAVSVDPKGVGWGPQQPALYGELPLAE